MRSPTPARPATRASAVGYVNAPRPTFDTALETAIDVSTGARSLDTRPGERVDTGRDLDIALGGARIPHGADAARHALHRATVI